MRFTILLSAMALLPVSACIADAPAYAPLQASESNSAQPTDILTPVRIAEILSADDMQGRLAGEEGATKARKFLVEQLRRRGLTVSEQGFTFLNSQGEVKNGINLLARINGKNSASAMVITAHYDHVGIIDGETYNGASDNATGVAGAFAIADQFLAEMPENDVIIALLDAEEPGLFGAKTFVKQRAFIGSDIAFNINLDMIAGYEQDALYASGSYHNPQLLPLLTTLAQDAPINVKLGHDRPEQGADDWTLLSDHGPFHNEGIAFIYFGVEDHKYYHQPGDTFDTLPKEFFAGALRTVVMAAQAIDKELETAATKPDED